MTWKDDEKWQRMLSGEKCPFCEDCHLDENQFSYKVVELPSSYVRFPKNQYWRGWVLVALKEHKNELFEMSKGELSQYWEDVAKAANAVNAVFQPVKLNYAIFGNLCPHIHCHILPQYLDSDPYASIELNKKKKFLEEEEYLELIEKLRSEIN